MRTTRFRREWDFIKKHRLTSPPPGVYAQLETLHEEKWPCWGCFKPIEREQGCGGRPFFFHDDTCKALALLRGPDVKHT